MKSWMRLAAIPAACLVAGEGVAMLLFVTWLHAPRNHAIAAFAYLLTSGLLSLVAGGAAVLLVARLAPSLGAKIAVASIVGTAAAIVNVLLTPLLMFTEQSDRYILVITLLYFLAISLAFAFILATMTTGQLRALSAGAQRLAEGELGTRVPVAGADEVAELARAFNRMSADLSDQFERQRRLEDERRDLIAAVSHDLRTPLASVRAMVEAINDGVVSEPLEVRRYLSLIQLGTERLGRLIDDLFELSRIESGTLELRLSRIPLQELVTETVAGLRIQAEERGILLQAVIGAGTPALELDALRIQRVLVNLIENALRHTPEGGSVQVEVTPSNGHVQVTVADTGEGIAPEDQPHVFDRFYRGEKSRSRESGGTGLGLAIARGIVEAHRGSIRVESTPGHGSRFVMTL